MYVKQPKKLLILNILDILRKYSDEDHRLSQREIGEILKTEYGMTADRKAIRRNLSGLLECGYGSLECVEETLYAGEWLYKHTSIPTTQQLVLKLVAAYGKSLHPQGDVVDNLRQAIQEKPYIFLTLDFVEKIAAQLPMAEPSSLERLNRQVTEKLNQEFLRCRLGGLYNTVPGCWDLYFRISNLDFNWEPAIRRFLETHRDEMETVTVVWDEESTGREGFFFHPSGKPMNRIPWKGDAAYGKTP